MHIKEASSSYEAWMQRHTSVVRRDLEIKHQRMAESPFSLFACDLLPMGATLAQRVPGLSRGSTTVVGG